MRDSMTRQMRLWISVAAVLVLVLLSQGLGGAGAQPGSTTTPARMNGKVTATAIAGRLSSAGFDPSLELKEKVDFLLTPALLVQEALSEDAVLTYPTE